MAVQALRFRRLEVYRRMAAVGAAFGELGSAKSAALAILFWILTSYAVSMTIYLVGTYWWTIFIFAAATAGIMTTARIVNKKRSVAKEAQNA